MKYWARIGDREVEVGIEERESRLVARIAGAEHVVSYAEVDGLGQYSIVIDGKSWAPSIEPAQRGSTTEYTVGLVGELFAVSIENERERAARAAERTAAKGSRTVRAAMPGIVVSLAVKVGDHVDVGAPLLVLEAMKMQNEVRCEMAGTVTRVHTAAGRTVAAGSDLLTIEA